MCLYVFVCVSVYVSAVYLKYCWRYLLQLQVATVANAVYHSSSVISDLLSKERIVEVTGRVA